MVYTVTKLITNAYYVSGIVGREFQTVSGSQLGDGLDLLNEILTDKYTEKDMIPYYTQYDFASVAGQEKYFIPNLIEVETLVFFINSVRYQMEKKFRIQYFGDARANNIQSLPYTWHFEREKGGGSLYLYFEPNQAYPMQLWGQFGLSEVSFNQDLSLTYDQDYISYLKYALASRLCIDFNYEIPAGAETQLLKYEMRISKKSGPLDLHMQKVSTLGNKGFLNYAIVNFSGGWV